MQPDNFNADASENNQEQADQPQTLLNSTNLPRDVGSLNELRERLEDYLTVLEQNTDAASKWLDANEEKVIDFHHKLYRTIVKGGSEQETLQLLTSMGDAAGFVLSISDFHALAASTYGEQSPVVAKIDAIPLGMPQHLLEPLPSIEVAPKDPSYSELPEIEPEKVGFFSAMFGGKEKAEKRAQQLRDEQARQLRDKWQKTRDQLISLQSDRHYYIDSFMDDIAGEWGAETDDDAKAAAKLAFKYQEPAYVINLAQRDYAEVMEVRTEKLRAQAAHYSAFAKLLDDKDVNAFNKSIAGYLGSTEAKLVFNDPYYKGSTFAEIALNYFTDREAQFKLFTTALKYEPFKLSKQPSLRATFERMMEEILAKDPLTSEAFPLAMKSMKMNAEPSALLQKDGDINYLQKIIRRFKGDISQTTKVMEDYFRGITGNATPPSKAIAHVLEFADALEKEDTSKLEDVITSIRLLGNFTSENQVAFLSLWQLCYPEKDILQSIEDLDASTVEKASLIYTAFQAGLVEQMKLNQNAAKESLSSTIRVLNKYMLNPSNEDGLQRMRLMLAEIFVNGGLETLRQNLTQHTVISDDRRPWLCNIASRGDLDDATRIKWIAALIEPFPSDIVRANILAEAAKTAANLGFKDAATLLTALEEGFSSQNPRINQDQILQNLDKIANVWFTNDGEKQPVLFTLNGEGHRVLVDNASTAMANEILTLLERKGNFVREEDGLFRPENIDRIIETAKGPAISWQKPTDLPVYISDATLDALRNRTDYLHGFNSHKNQTTHININSIALIEPLRDNNLLVLDKYGHHFVLSQNSRFTLPENDFVALGNGVFMNPAHAGIVSIDNDEKKLKFRIESSYFDNTLRSAETPGFYYDLPLPKADALQALNEALAEKFTEVSKPTESNRLFFNMEAVEYMRFTLSDLPNKSGFEYFKYGSPGNKVQIPAEPDVVTDITNALEKNNDVLCVVNTAVAKSIVQNIYYVSEEKKLYIITNKSAIQVACDEKPAQQAMREMDKYKNYFKTLYVEPHKDTNSSIPSVYEANTASDLIDLEKTVMLQFDQRQQKTIATNNGVTIDIILGEGHAHHLFDQIEAKGLKPTGTAITLQQALDGFSQSIVNVKRPLCFLDGKELLRSVIENGTFIKQKELPKIAEDFRVASLSSASTSDRSFVYPVITPKTVAPANSQKPQATKKSARPGL